MTSTPEPELSPAPPAFTASDAPTPPSAPSSRVARLARYALPVLFIGALVFGVVLRVHHLDQPRRNTFDEDHFSVNAQRLLEGKPDRNDHPPLGKLLLMPSMAVLGDTEVGRRLVPCLIGLCAIGLAFWTGKRLFPGLRYAGAAAASLVALDGFFVAYSRCSLLDGMLAALFIAILGLCVDLRRTRDIALAAVLLGLAMSIKWSGVTFVVPIAVGLLLARNLRGGMLLVLAPVVYVAIFALGLWLGGVDPTPEAILAKHGSLAAGHLNQHHMKHPATSYWWTWLWMDNPIIYRKDGASGGRLVILSTMGNPLFWWTSTLAVLGSFVALGAALVRRLRRGAAAVARGVSGVRHELAAFYATHRRGVLLLLAAWAAPLAPWILTKRDSYIYHYLPSYAAALLLLAGLAVAFLAKRPKVVAAVLLVAVVSVIYFAPMMQAWPISKETFENRLWLPRWR